MAKNTRKDFTNVEEVFDKMFKFGFFGDEDDKKTALVHLTNQAFHPRQENSYFYTNGTATVKIKNIGREVYELLNFYEQENLEVSALFLLADIPKR